MKTKEKKSEAISTSEVVVPQDLNHYGSLFGGKLLSWMDKTAYFASASFCGFPCVTVSIESLDFKLSLKNGDVLKLIARVIFSGRTSMVVKVDVYKNDIFGANRDFLANSGFFTFVALDKKGKPQVVPSLIIDNDDDQMLFEKGRQVKENAIKRRHANKL